MVSHLTWVCTLEMRGGFSPELLLPSYCSQVCPNQTHRLSVSIFHCKGKVRVCTAVFRQYRVNWYKDKELPRFSFDRSVGLHPNIAPICDYWTSHSVTSSILWSQAFQWVLEPGCRDLTPLGHWCLVMRPNSQWVSEVIPDFLQRGFLIFKQKGAFPRLLPWSCKHTFLQSITVCCGIDTALNWNYRPVSTAGTFWRT